MPTPNLSPWIAQLRREQAHDALAADAEADVLVVGGGIAGVMTAFFLLDGTDRRVTLLEAGRIAHGATGHNAGQVVAAFERPLTDIAVEFGEDAACRAQGDIERAWDLLEEVYVTAGLTAPLHRVTGRLGLTEVGQIAEVLQGEALRRRHGLQRREIFAVEGLDLSAVAEELLPMCGRLSRDELLRRLDTADAGYVGLIEVPRGCVNSALLCEEVLGYLLAAHPTRFTVHEHSPVQRVVLHDGFATVHVAGHAMRASRTVLCTNGFEHFSIEQERGVDIDGKFHHLVRGTIGYMAGYLDERTRGPAVTAYLTEPDADTRDPYYYLTRRPYEKDGKPCDLVAIGGPELVLEERSAYAGDKPFPQEAQDHIDAFLHRTYVHAPPGDIPYVYKWHGLMGYTPNGIRLIGTEPCNDALLYNLGCNGIGILPSVHGGKRIADILSGKAVEPSIFDPRDRRCML